MRRALPLLTVLLLPSCASEPATEATTEESVTLEGATGTLELTGDPETDIDALVDDFPRDYAQDVACDPPDGDAHQIAWASQLRDITRQHSDWYAAQDAIRVTVHYDCPEHYDAVDEAL